MRQVVLDTETTGLDPQQGHRLIEVGCLEIINRRVTKKTFHHYLNPERAVDEGAFAVHGISDDFLADKPRFTEIVDDLWAFIADAELIIHNAAFDLGFINHELRLLKNAPLRRVEDSCRIFDTLTFARKKHRGQRNSLDALCKRYEIDNGHRTLHGALLDAEILADVYLAMTGGQGSLLLGGEVQTTTKVEAVKSFKAAENRPPLKIYSASADELLAHRERLAAIKAAYSW